MSSLYDMISAFIAMLMSAAFLHFGAAGDSRPATPVAQVSPPPAASPARAESADAVIDDNDEATRVKPVRNQARHAVAQCRKHGDTGGSGVIDTVRAQSPLRHG
jgi:hypothetical protein